MTLYPSLLMSDCLSLFLLSPFANFFIVKIKAYLKKRVFYFFKAYLNKCFKKKKDMPLDYLEDVSKL